MPVAPPRAPAPPPTPEADPFASVGPRARRRQRWKKLGRNAWWLHSAWALIVGIGVMLVSRRGLEYADTLLWVLACSWLIVFVALRFVVGAQNRRPDEKMARRGLRILTNYVIKQLYQQMFFFLVPLYASSATWSFSSPNWWLIPLLLLFAVVSTLDLVFDNVVMERRVIASTMYGLCMFGLLNLVLPLSFALSHFQALLCAAAATPPTVALLTFPMGRVFSRRGLIWLAAATALATGAAYFGRRAVPPAPLAVVAMAVGHGAPGEFECVPGKKTLLRVDQLTQLRCVSELTAVGNSQEPVIHVWRHDGAEVARLTPAEMEEEACPGLVFRSQLTELPGGSPIGGWSCAVETEDGQLIGMQKFAIVPGPGP